MRHILLCSSIFLLVLSGCVNRSNETLLGGGIQRPKIPMVDNLYPALNEEQFKLDQVYQLSSKQIANFLKFYQNPFNKELPPNQRISRYLKNELPKFKYVNETLNASDSIKLGQGNCLSLAIVTKSLSKLVNVDISYELVATPPSYSKSGDLVFISQHVRTLLLNPKPNIDDGFFLLLRGGTRIDYFPGPKSLLLRKVSEEEFDAMYFNNLAAEAMGTSQNGLAYSYLMQSLKLNPFDKQSINMLAVLHEKSGYHGYSEKLYRYGIKYGGESFELLNNYHNLLTKMKRLEEAKLLSSRLRKYEDPNPYKWIELGNRAHKKQDYKNALHFYNKANDLARYLHEPYAGVAKVKLALGEIDAAKSAYVKALDKSEGQEINKIYKTAYDKLNRQKK